MMNSMGDYPMAIALGIVLLIISFIINSILYTYSGGRINVEVYVEDIKKILF